MQKSDLENLKSIVKPFLKDKKLILDAKSPSYETLSEQLSIFLEEISFNRKAIHPAYDPIFSHLLAYAQLDTNRCFKNYSRDYAKRFTEKFFKESLLNQNNHKEIYEEKFIRLIKKNGKINLTANKIINSEGIFKNKILIDKSFIEFLSNKTIQLIIKKTTISDPSIEKIFTEVRKIILEAAIKDKELINNNNVQNFSLSLATNCFFNEYSWFEAREENENIEILEEDIYQKMSKNKKIIPAEIFILGAYKPLYEFPKIQKGILKFEHPIIKEQISNFLIEESCIDKIKTIAPIKNKISLRVKNQYEKYPYPRWNSHNRKNEKGKYINYIKKITSPELIEKDIKKILIAGCGTGRHPINIALMDPSIDIYALDLSKKSLAYGYRKSKEMNISNIRWMHGDILHLKSIKDNFDVIESIGVLHHMENPKQAFDILTDILNPNGLLRIGLYAKSYRSRLKPVKEFLKKNKISKDLKSIQKARRLISKSSNKEIMGNAINILDFYSSSSFIDLLMHEQELDFEINDLIKMYEKDYNFLGFLLNPLHKQLFETTLKKIKVTENELENWKLIEKIEKGFFSNMYQFTLQKK